MTAPRPLPDAPSWDDRMRDQLAAVARRPPDERIDALAAVVRSLIAEQPDQLSRAKIRAYVKRARLLPVSDFDQIAREAAQLAAPVAAPDHSGLANAEAVPGAEGYAYRPALGDDQGAIFKHGRNGWVPFMAWAPRCVRVYRTDEGRRYYEVEARGESVTAAGAELASAEVWERLPVPGTGSRRVRELLNQIVLAEADGAPAVPAVAFTGWQRDDSGALFYVFADGRTYPPDRPVFLAGRPVKLAPAAAPVPEVEPALIAKSLGLVRAHDRGPCLLGLGVGARSLGQSLHKVLGGYVADGPPNAGKTNVAWHARTLLIARPGRAASWPPLPTATFNDRAAAIEAAVHFERDMPALIDDAALHDKSTRAEVAAVTNTLEQLFRPLANDSPIRERSNIELTLRAARYVNSPIIATTQDFPVQDSLRRRVFVIKIRRGDIDIPWYKSNSASLVGPLRSLGEHYLIPYLAHLGPAGAAQYLQLADAAAAELLAPRLDVELPGWRESGEGLAGVVDVAAAAIAGLLMIGDVIAAVGDQLAVAALDHAVRCLVAQGRELADGAEVASMPEALAELVRAALLDQRAHIRNEQGEAWPSVPGLSPQEQGLERISGAGTDYRGRGVPLYWLIDDGALGVRGDSLHSLIKRAADPRLPSTSARGLPRELVEAGAALPGRQKSSPYSNQKWVGGANHRLVYLRPSIIFPDTDTPEGLGEPLEPLEPLGPSSAGEIRTQATEAAPASESAQVNTPDAEVTDAAGDVRISQRDQRPSGSSGSEPLGTARNAAEAAPEVPEQLAEALDWAPGEVGACVNCHAPTRRYGPHGRPFCSACEGAPRPTSAVGNQAAPEALAPTRPPRRARADQAGPPNREQAREAAPSIVAPSPLPFLVLGDGEAFGPDGEVVAAPELGELVEVCGTVGELAGLALALGTPRLYVPRLVREALGLPPSIPAGLGDREGAPHPFAEAPADAWDVRPDQPLGLGAWMNVFRVPRSGDGAAVAFAEYLPPEGGKSFDLPPAQLAEALTLIWRAGTYSGNGGVYGGAHFHRSGATTFKHLMDASARRSRDGRPEAVVLPPPFTAKPVKGVPPLGRPQRIYAARAEVPAGWIVAALDVRKCYASAARSTPIGYGAPRKIRPGEVGKLPGVHLLRVPADQAEIAAGLARWFPLPSSPRVREVGAWLDTAAAAWVIECLGDRVRVDESWVYDDSRRIFDSPIARMIEAGDRLGGDPSPAAQLAAAVVKAGPNRYLGGWLASTFGGKRAADDWHQNQHAALAVASQAEVRKQRNLVPMIGAGVRVLGGSAIDHVYVAAPSIEALIHAPGTGGRPAIVEVRPSVKGVPPIEAPSGAGAGKFRIEQLGEVTPELSAALAEQRASYSARLSAIREALGAQSAELGGAGDE